MPNAASDNAAETTAELICESCGAEFPCGAKIGECWCFKMELPSASLADLRGRYKDCLCERCLSVMKKHSTK